MPVLYGRSPVITPDPRRADGLPSAKPIDVGGAFCAIDTPACSSSVTKTNVTYRMGVSVIAVHPQIPERIENPATARG
jgi:hypothetical protein